MSRKRSKVRSSRADETAHELNEAVRTGKVIATRVLKFRATQQRRRRAFTRGLSAESITESRDFIPEHVAKALGPERTTGVLIAEGDSWFDYPLNDVLRLLEDEHGFDVESVAHKGDNVEDMAYSGGQFEEFARRLEKLLRAGKVPKAILLSGGGNDIAGNEFALLLNHEASSLPPLSEEVVRGVIDLRIRDAYATIISGLTTICQRYLGRPIPIVTHGYDYPVPDGRGFMGGWGPLPGPWLRPGFIRKGHKNLETNKRLMKQLIDRFNAMIKELVALPAFSHVRYVHLLGTLATDGNYKQYWANELHPSPKGFQMVTRQFADLIGAL